MADPEKQGQPEIPVAKIVSPREREKFVDLDYPVEFDGVLYEKIRIRRVSGKEIADFSAAMQMAIKNDTEMPIPPVVDCPVAVWNALDADDQANVDDAAQAFMPRRLKVVADRLGLLIGELTSDS